MFLASRTFAQSSDDQLGEKPLSPLDITVIAKKAQSLLHDVVPHSPPPGVPYARQPDQPTERLETAEGIVQWGNLFTPDETVALVNLGPPSDIDDGPYDFPPRYLCVFAWQDGQWRFRQFLGNIYNVTVHHRRDQPAAFLQGSRPTGRYDGDHLSWYYDPAGRQLVPTNFEDWGPFYLVGNYLILGRGFERLAHDEPHWVYSYKNGRKGRLLASLNENDSGRFDIECRDPKSGRMQNWHFKPVGDEQGDRLSIVVEDESKENGTDGAGQGGQELTAQLIEQITRGKDGLSQGDYFGFLTGLNPALLGDKWLDEPPKWSAPKRLPVKVTGSKAIVDRFR